MATTVAIEDTTRQRLQRLKEKWEAKSLDEVIQRLLDEVQPVPKSMFGADPGLPRLTRALRDDIWGEEPLARKGRRRGR